MQELRYQGHSIHKSDAEQVKQMKIEDKQKLNAEQAKQEVIEEDASCRKCHTKEKKAAETTVA